MKDEFKKEEMIELVKMLICHIEGLCSGIKSDPQYLSGYNTAIEMLTNK